MNIFIKKIVFSPLLASPVAGFIKQQVDQTKGQLSLTGLYTETGKVDKTAVPLHPSTLLLDGTKKSKPSLDAETQNFE